MEIFTKILTLVAVIFLGWLVKRIGLVPERAIGFLSALVLNFTLPCTIINGLNGIWLDPSYFALLSLGFLLNLGYLGLGRISCRENDLTVRCFSMINISGFNIGMFAMAFIQSFFDAKTFMMLCLCDVGNAIMTMGGNYAVAARTCRVPGIDKKAMLRIVLSCVGFHCYILIIALCTLQIAIPDPFISGIKAVATINPYLCMFMIGLGLKFTINRNAVHLMMRILAPRYLAAGIVCVLLLLAPIENRSLVVGLCLFLLSPVSGLAPVYTYKFAPHMLKDSSMVCCLSIFISTLIYIVVIPLFLQHVLN